MINDVLVTGASGFIGKRLVETIKNYHGDEARVHALSSKDVDLINRQQVFDYFERLHWTWDVKHIVHLAAVYKAGGWPQEHPATQFHTNMAININLLEAWRRFFPKARLTSVISYCCYPDHDKPHPESELYGTEPEEYLFAYAFTKKALLIGQRAYVKEYGLSAACGVLPTVYGLGDSFAENSHVMGALIGKFKRAAESNHPEVEVWGDGTQEREFLYVDDAVSGISCLAEEAKSDVLNLGVGQAFSVREIAETIKSQTGFTGEIVYNTDRFVGALRRVLDVTQVRQEVSWRPQVNLEEGIRRTIETYP